MRTAAGGCACTAARARWLLRLRVLPFWIASIGMAVLLLLLVSPFSVLPNLMRTPSASTLDHPSLSCTSCAASASAHMLKTRVACRLCVSKEEGRRRSAAARQAAGGLALPPSASNVRAQPHPDDLPSPSSSTSPSLSLSPYSRIPAHSLLLLCSFIHSPIGPSPSSASPRQQHPTSSLRPTDRTDDAPRGPSSKRQQPSFCSFPSPYDRSRTRLGTSSLCQLLPPAPRPADQQPPLASSSLSPSSCPPSLPN